MEELFDPHGVFPLGYKTSPGDPNDGSTGTLEYQEKYRRRYRTRSIGLGFSSDCGAAAGASWIEKFGDADFTPEISGKPARIFVQGGNFDCPTEASAQGNDPHFNGRGAIAMVEPPVPFVGNIATVGATSAHSVLGGDPGFDDSKLIVDTNISGTITPLSIIQKIHTGLGGLNFDTYYTWPTNGPPYGTDPASGLPITAGHTDVFSFLEWGDEVNNLDTTSLVPRSGLINPIPIPNGGPPLIGVNTSPLSHNDLMSGWVFQAPAVSGPLIGFPPLRNLFAGFRTRFRVVKNAPIRYYILSAEVFPDNIGPTFFAQWRPVEVIGSEIAQHLQLIEVPMPTAEDFTVFNQRIGTVKMKFIIIGETPEEWSLRTGIPLA